LSQNKSEQIFLRFRPGDTVVELVKVKEGTRTRLQAFEGVVMGVKKGGINASFVVRKFQVE